MDKRGKLSILFFCLVALLFMYPCAGKAMLLGKVLAIFFSVILIAGVFAVGGHSRVKLTISLILAVLSIIFIWFDQFFAPQILDVITFLLMALFSFFTVGCIVSYLLDARKITKDILAGAASAYLLIGISFSMLCGLLEMVAPVSFSVSQAMGADALSKWATFNYYSFTTLTTLGYGDITPLTARAQSLAVIEAVTGVLFTVLLISRLVGIYVHQTTQERKKES